MNQAVTKFVSEVLEEVRYKRIRPYIQMELEDHIECIKEDYEASGIASDQAYEKATLQMGDASAIGKALHRLHKPRCEWVMVLLMGILLAIGLGTLNMIAAANIENVGAHYASKQLQFITLGALCFVGG